MVGLVIVAHGNLSKEFVHTTEIILGDDIHRISSVSISPTESSDAIEKKIRDAIKSVDDGDGVLIFTDMFGGTPSNISLSFLDEGKVEVISGINLPMMIKAVTEREGVSLVELGQALRNTGRENISLASDLLKKN